MKILVIAAHPDDEVLGCGGTIARFAEEGNSVHICVVCDGVIARDRDDVRQMEKCAKDSAKVLGATDICFLNFKDQRLDEIPIVEINKSLEKIMQKFKPEIVFTHYRDDLNKDHRIVYEATMVAARPFGIPVKKVYQYEVLSSTEWGFTEFRPNTFVEIKKTIGKKIDAFSKYKTEIRDFPHPRSIEGIRVKAMYNGMKSGFEFAEAFILERDLL